MEKINQKFVNKELNLSLDVYRDDGREWFKAQDISEFLGYCDTHHMTRYIRVPEQHIKKVRIRSKQGNAYDAIFIDENALYEVLLRVTQADITRYNKARALYIWIVNDIIPVLDLRFNIKMNQIIGR